RIIGALAGAAILSGLTACGGAAAPAPVGRADSALPSAMTPQTANPTPSPTPSPSPVRTPTPAPTVNALAIGDSCLVGRWTLMSLLMTDTASVPGVTLTFTGQLGTVMTVGVEGTEVEDLTNPTGLGRAGNGHAISGRGKGVHRDECRGE